MVGRYEPEWKGRLRRNMAHASYVETAPLMEPGVDAGYFGTVVRYLTSPDSRLVLEEGHLSGLNLHARDIIRAALVPRQMPGTQSTIALHTVDVLAQLQETAEEGGYLCTKGHAILP